MKIKTKKSQQVKPGKKVRSNSIIRTRAFIYDLYSKTNSNGRIILNEMVVYHKCGNNILAAMRDREFRRIKVTKDDDRGFEWIGPAPTENMIQDVQNRINEIGRKYMQEYLAKGKSEKKTPMLEFVFDTEVDQSKSNPVDNDADVNQLKNLLQKLFGVKI
jgi:predicted SAM-dependent methyltransferase